jgi:ABC-type antimicrobial peptide transport system permease subunit
MHRRLQNADRLIIYTYRHRERMTILAAMGKREPGNLLTKLVFFILLRITSARLVTIFLGVFFGYYPAQAASRLDPIEALRYE